MQKPHWSHALAACHKNGIAPGYTCDFTFYLRSIEALGHLSNLMVRRSNYTKIASINFDNLAQPLAPKVISAEDHIDLDRLPFFFMFNLATPSI